MNARAVTVRSLTLADFDKALPRLAEILHACVHGGASVNFILPFDIGDATAFWVQKVRPGLETSEKHVLVAESEGILLGTVQLIPASQPNQRHRADVAKLLVHPDARRLGAAKALMIAIEDTALKSGRTLLTLDTQTGSVAEKLYENLGYQRLGVLPDFSLAVKGDVLEASTYFYKHLKAHTGRT